MFALSPSTSLRTDKIYLTTEHIRENRRESRTTSACTVHIQVLIKIESKSSLSLSQHYKRHYPTTYLHFQCTLLLKHTVLPFLSECRSSVVCRANALICKAPTHLTVLNINFSFFGRRGQFLVRNKFRRNCFLRKGSSKIKPAISRGFSFLPSRLQNYRLIIKENKTKRNELVNETKRNHELSPIFSPLWRRV